MVPERDGVDMHVRNGDDPREGAGTRADGRGAVARALTLLAILATLGGCAGPTEREPRAGETPSGETSTDGVSAREALGEALGGASDAGPEASPRVAVPDPLPRGDDLDGDRVADARDDCPDTEAGEVVDATGCALFSRVLEGVVFAPSDFRLGAASREALAPFVADLAAHPTIAVRIEGHTDNRGTAAANLELSKRRVMSVARFLVASGIAPARLKPYGYGESRPRAGNASESGRERNRRIEIERWYPPVPLADPGAAGQNATDAE